MTTIIFLIINSFCLILGIGMMIANPGWSIWVPCVAVNFVAVVLHITNLMISQIPKRKDDGTCCEYK